MALRPSLPISPPAKQRKGFVFSTDETPIYYEVIGKSQPAQTLVFCDGIGCDGYIWKYLQRTLQDEYRIIHFHYRGHGKTPRPQNAAHVSIEHLADDIALVLDACETKSAILFGHSMGVQVALETYRRHKNRVDGLVLMCGSHSHPLRTFRGKNTLEKALPFLRFLVNCLPKTSNFLWSHIVPSMLSYKVATKVEINGRLVRHEDFFPYFEAISRIDLRLFLNMMAAAGRHSTLDLLDRIRVPTFIVAGKRDSFTPMKLSLDMHERIASSELYVVEDGSHTAPLERPVEVTGKIVDFLSRHIPSL